MNALLDRLVTLTLLCPALKPARVEIRTLDKDGDEIERGLPEEYDKIAAKMRDEVVIPIVRSRPFGTVATVDIRKLIPYYKYQPRFELLTIMNRGLNACRRVYRQTEYYRDQQSRHGAWLATFKVARYYRLLRSVMTEGLKLNLETRENLPLLFCAKDIYFRLDGTHRTSVARFLGHETMPAVVITPQDVLSLADLPGDVEEFVRGLLPPEEGAFSVIGGATAESLSQSLSQS